MCLLYAMNTPGLTRIALTVNQDPFYLFAYHQRSSLNNRIPYQSLSSTLYRLLME